MSRLGIERHWTLWWVCLPAGLIFSLNSAPVTAISIFKEKGNIYFALLSKLYALKSYFFIFFCWRIYVSCKAWHLLATFHQAPGTLLAIPVNSMHRLIMSLHMIGSKCLASTSIYWTQKWIGTTLIWFFFCRSKSDSDPMERSHEMSVATSIRSGSTSRLRQQNDESVAKTRSLSSRIRRLYSKWRRTREYRFDELFCVGLSKIVVIINSILIIWGSKSFDVNIGIGTIQHEQCDRTKNLSLWLHLAINILDTALLSASNYIMQCLSFSTRRDIDKAHARNTWLDIGVPSVRNLSRITRKRTALWRLLAITSLPLHLMYNSAVFETLSTNEYQVYTVSKDFLSGAPFESQDSDDFPPEIFTQQLNSLRDPNSGIHLRNMTTRECILTYSDAFANSKYKNVLAVSSLNDATNSLLDFVYSGRPDLRQQQNLWFCGDYEDDRGYCNVAEAAAQTLTVAEYPIDYCLVQEVDEECMLQFSLSIMLIVIICNLIKTVCMIWVAFEKRPRFLMTVDDAIASFLSESDSTTKNFCLADRDFFRKKGWQATLLIWKFKRHRWFRTASMKRWFVFNVLWVIYYFDTKKSSDDHKIVVKW